MKSSAIFFVALGLLLTGMALPVRAQDVTPAPAATEQTETSTQTTSVVSTEAPVTATVVPEKPAVTAVAPSAEIPKPADTATSAAPATAVSEESDEEEMESATTAVTAVAPAGSAAETPKPADTAASAAPVAPAAPAAGKTEAVSQAEAPTPAVEKPVTAETSSQPVPSKRSGEEGKSDQPAVATASQAVVSAEKPATTESVTAKPDDAKQAAADNTATPTAVVPEKSSVNTSADESAKMPAASVPEKPAEEKPVAEKGSDFELDRSAANAASAKVEAGSQPPKTSFWGRLFGRDKAAPSAAATDGRQTTDDSLPAEALAKAGPRTEASAEVKPPAATVDMKAPSKMLTPEEVVAAQEEVRRQAKEVEALKALDLAYQAMGRNDFEAALKYFNQAMNVMPIRPHTVETRQKAMQSQAECEYRIALNYYKIGKYKETKEAIRRALGYNPAHQKAARLSEQVKKDEIQDVARAAVPVPVRHSTEHLDRVKQISASLDLGRQYYAIGEYEKARREFKNVLVIDEKNDDAAAWLKKVYEKMYNLETDQMNRQQADMVSQVRDTWTPPVKRETAGPEAKLQDTTITDRGKRRLLEKLNSIVIPQLEFRQANINDVIKFLDQASIAYDKDSPPGEKGVNFIMPQRGAAAAGTAPAAVQPAEGELTGEGGATVTQGNLPTVTLSLRNVSLMDSIKYITEVTGLKYRIEENVVVITPSEAVYGDLITKTYRVQPSIAETIMGAAGSAGGGGGGGDRMELGGNAPTVERGDVKKFFVDAGVPFPEGTSIAYRPSLNLMIVKNTSENLENFERILTSLNDVPKQVEIEARFVEVAQNDLEELGVEWILNDNWELAENAGAGAAIPIAGRERVQVNQNTFSKGLRNLAQGASGVSATPGGNMAGILSISSILTNPEMTMILHALEQRSGANLLSAPKVTTKSGANAEIKVVKEWIYPTEFELTPPQVSGSGSGSQAVISKAFVTPASFQTRDTGVILNVTPTVGPDGFSIDLVMLPQVVELSEWYNYGSTIVDPTTGLPELMNMPQPIFKSRNITTSITIWDGQTVVMGGMITERQTTTLDKIPFLGDIPLLGYLFQSKTSSSEKYNLLIFVTANLVDPAGNKINKDLIAPGAGTVSTPSAAASATP